MKEIIESLRLDLQNLSDPALQLSSRRFFKEEIQCYGINTAVVVRLGKQHFVSLKGKPKSVIFECCEELWKSGNMEESFIASNWSHEIYKSFEPDDFFVFEGWVSKYVSNWASCDTLCNHTVGEFLEKYPSFISHLEQWAHSGNRWVKRASAVSLILPARKGLFLQEIFRIADILLPDTDDLVRKGYGWMLKAASQAHQQEVFQYVMNHRTDMPRTALRYAIEKMPLELRIRAMEK